MPRPRSVQPTPAELAVLGLLWERGPLAGPEIAEALNEDADPPRAYTSVMSLLTTMLAKGLVARRPQGRTHVYSAARDRHPTRVELVRQLVRQAFDGSARDLVAGLLDGTAPDSAELAAIRRLVEQYEADRPARGGDRHDRLPDGGDPPGPAADP